MPKKKKRVKTPRGIRCYAVASGVKAGRYTVCGSAKKKTLAGYLEGAKGGRRHKNIACVRVGKKIFCGRIV